MYDSIQGRVALREPARVVIEAGGLGYVLQVPLGTYESVPAPGSEVRLLVHLVVREDDWRLFGFATAHERALFRDLLRVSGVGPAAAMALLSGLGADALVEAVTQDDVRALTRVKGVGKKTSERVVLDLKDSWSAQRGAGGRAAPAAPSGVDADAVRALETLGLEPAEAERRVKALRSAGVERLSLADLVRRALRG